MACECKKEAKLSWVRGNDVLLSVWLYERYLDGVKEKLRPFVFDGTEELHMQLANFYGRKFDLEPHPGEEAGQLLVDIPGSVPTGTYSIELTLVKEGRDVRSCESCMVRVVESNNEANTVLTPIESGRRAETEMTIQLVSSAIARGENAYELWLEAGNEGSLQDYLDLFIQPASRTQQGQMTPEAYCKLESIEEMSDSDVDDAWERVFGNNSNNN